MFQALVGATLLPWAFLVVICAERLKTSFRKKREVKPIIEDEDSEDEDVNYDDMPAEN